VTDRRVSVPGADLHYATDGRGPVCLVLSAIGTKPYERMLAPALGGRLRLVFVDPRGSGSSTGDALDLTLDVLAQDLDAIRADLGAERTSVFGHSILGVLAIEYARRRPESVSHVILAGTPPLGDMTRVAASAAEFFEENASEDRRRILRENMAKLPPAPSPGQVMFAQTPTRFFDARLDAAPLFAGSEARPEFFARLFGPLTAGWDVTVGSNDLTVPILVAHGRHDYTVPWILWKDAAPRLPDATLELFEESGHHPFVEEPARFAWAVTEWMASRG